MSNPPPAAKKSEKMQKSDQKLQQQTTANKNADGVVEPCPLEKKKTYTHLGLRLRVSQYPIGGRKLALDVPVIADAESIRPADEFHKLTGSGFKPAEPIDNPPSPHKLYKLGADGGQAVFQCDLTNNAGFLRETGVDYYQRQKSGKAESQLNNLLGQSFALHLQRSGVFRNPKTGNFYCTDIQANTPALIKTEKFAAKFFVYIDMKLNGKAGVYLIENGKISLASISAQEYDEIKHLNSERWSFQPRYSDKQWGKMVLNPGVQQFHVLLAESGASFILKEVYCDGDRIYPE